MNHHKYQINCKKLYLLVTLVSTFIFSSSAALANSRLKIVPNRQIDRSPSLHATSPDFTPRSAPVHLAATPAQPNRSSTSDDRQIAQASDVTGNWAEPFIKALVEKGIIAGYPDGTFRPDQPVTRAEFAALLTKAFELEPTRASRAFKDVSQKFWGASVIDKAYRAGFLSGYPNNTFGPNQNIIRIESLVAIANSSKLRADSSASKIDQLFSDVAQVPNFGRDALIAATQKCVTVSVSYPESKTFNPAEVATRADVAAFIHQALVAAGKLTALASDSPAQKYIVNCAAAPSVAKITEQDVLNRIGIGAVPSVETAATTVRKPSNNAPVSGITTPSGFGANWGTVFIGSGYQDSLAPFPWYRGTVNTAGFGLGAGFGIGNSRDLVGLETSYSTSSNGGGPDNSSPLGLFNRGAVNFKLHKQFGNNIAIAAGWENAIKNGYAGNDQTVRDTFYGVVTGVLPVSDTNNFTASVGIGNGRFRQIGDIVADRDRTSFFGSLGFRISENIGIVTDYNGRNFSVGLPLNFRLSDSIGIQVTPAILDVAGDKINNEESRFGIGGGIGIRF
jgi:S-layer homology domain